MVREMSFMNVCAEFGKLCVRLANGIIDPVKARKRDQHKAEMASRQSRDPGEPSRLSMFD